MEWSNVDPRFGGKKNGRLIVVVTDRLAFEAVVDNHHNYSIELGRQITAGRDRFSGGFIDESMLWPASWRWTYFPDQGLSGGPDEPNC